MIDVWEDGEIVQKSDDWLTLDEPQPLTEDDYRRAIQRLIDAHAQSRRYDNGNSLATYATSKIPQWAAEATAFVAWRDAVWAYAYTELAKVLSGERDQPRVDVLVGELPELVWPNP